MHAQYVPVLTDIAPLLLIRELPQDEYPTPALPRPFTSQDVDPVMFGRRTSQVNLWRLLTLPSAHKRVHFELAKLQTAQTKITTADTCSISTHQTQIARMVRRKQYSLRRFDWSNASNFDAVQQAG